MNNLNKVKNLLKLNVNNTRQQKMLEIYFNIVSSANFPPKTNKVSTI